MQKLLYFILLFFVNNIQAQNFLREYEGTYEGQLVIYRMQTPSEKSGIKQKVIMRVTIEKIDTAEIWKYELKYIVKSKIVEERKYLIKYDTLTGNYIIDELNSIRLNAYLYGNTLVERFALPENEIVSITKFEKNQLYTQIISSEAVPVTWSGTLNGSPKVFSYFIDGYQDAILSKIKIKK